MEYREYTCPFCHELMQVPMDRDRIKCMFCGRDIALEFSGSDFGSQPDAVSILGRIDALLECAQAYMDKFNKKKYVGAFQEYMEEFSDVFGALESMAVKRESGITQGTEDLNEFPRLLAVKARQRMDSKPKKRQKQFENESLNLYVVSFLLPAIMEKGRGRMESILDDICREWKENLPLGSIRAASHEEIAKGFKNGIFGILKGWF